MEDSSAIMRAILDCYQKAGRPLPTQDQIFNDFEYYTSLYTVNSLLVSARKSKSIKEHAQYMHHCKHFHLRSIQQQEDFKPSPLPQIVFEMQVLRNDDLDNLFSSGLKNLTLHFTDDSSNIIQAHSFSALHLQFVHYILKRTPLLMQIALLNGSQYGVFKYPLKDHKSIRHRGGFIKTFMESGAALRSMMNWSDLAGYCDFSIHINPFDYDEIHTPENKYMLALLELKNHWL